MTKIEKRVSEMDLAEIAQFSQDLMKALDKQRKNIMRAIELVSQGNPEFNGVSVRGRQGRKLRRNYKNVTYVNPDNKEQTWVGRGRRPDWVNQAIKKHKVALEDLAA